MSSVSYANANFLFCSFDSYQDTVRQIDHTEALANMPFQIYIGKLGNTYIYSWSCTLARKVSSADFASQTPPSVDRRISCTVSAPSGFSHLQSYYVESVAVSLLGRFVGISF